MTHGARQAPGAGGAAEYELRLGRAQDLAEEARHIAARPADAPERARREAEHLRGYAPRARCRREARGPGGSIGQTALVQPVGKRPAELGAARCAKAEGGGEAGIAAAAAAP